MRPDIWQRWLEGTVGPQRRCGSCRLVLREASHLSTFSVRPCDVANSLTRLIWSLQSEMYVESVRMSSACEKAPR